MRARRARVVRQDLWPGFVDALASLLMVVIFLLSVFALAQHFLAEELSGRNKALATAEAQIQIADAAQTAAAAEISALKIALGAANEQIAAGVNAQAAAKEAYIDVSDQALFLEAALAQETSARHSTESALTKARDAITALQDEKTKLLSAQNNLGIAKQAVDDRLATSIAQVETLETRLSETISTKALLEADHQIAADQAAAEIATLKTRLSDAEKAIVALNRNVKVAASEAAQLREEQDLLIAAHDVVKAEGSTAATRAQNRIAALVAFLQQAKSATQKATALAAARQEQLDQAQGRLMALQRDLKDAELLNNTASALAESQRLDIERLRSEQEAERAKAAAQGQTQSAATEAAAQRSQRLEKALANALDRASKAESARDVLADLAGRIASDLSALRAVADTTATARAEAEKNAALLAGRSEAQTEAITEYRSRILKLETEIADLAARANALENAADAASTGLITARKAAEGLEAEKINAETERRRVAALNAELQQKVDQLNTALDAAIGDAKARGATILQLRGKLNSALAAKVSELRRFRSEFFGKLSAAIGDRKDIRIEGDRFVLQSEVLFGTAKGELGPAGQISMASIARSLQEITSVIPKDIDWVLRIDGHTDARPISNEEFASNRVLSAARANAVAKALAAVGIPEERLLPAGFGEYRPIDSGSTSDAYRRNRRIEIKLTQR
ncbi:MAG: OmpA family protein [Alphaproteobacteria bacterium]